MKNYVIWTNCQVNETEKKFGIEPCSDPESRQAYDTMFQISHASAKKFLAGDWEEIVFTDPAETRVHMFQQNWKRIWDIWHQEPCNILYLDSDTMFIRATEIFEKFAEYRLFNWTDPKSNSEFKNYFNAGVRYYPFTMLPEVWKIGEVMAENWNLDIWDQEQLIFNRMFWSQDIPETDSRHPELNWQGMMMRIPNSSMQSAHEEWNQFPINKTHIIHVHGSRDAVQTAQLMSNTAKHLGIQY